MLAAFALGYCTTDQLARSGRAGGGSYEPTGCPAPVSKSEVPVYATAEYLMKAPTSN